METLRRLDLRGVTEIGEFDEFRVGIFAAAALPRAG